MYSRVKALPDNVRQYMLVTFNYWNFTITDGALRMLVVLYFHQLGYSPLAVASLFLFYEFFGVVTNLVGGYLGARWGLNRTMNIGLTLQIVALAMLVVPDQWLTVIWVMLAQALSGIAKDFNKMSAKSAIKTLLPKDQKSRLFHWIAVLTGSKNALKGLGFFVGGGLLAMVGFQMAVLLMAAVLAIVLAMSLILLKQDLGRAKQKVKFRHLLSKNPQINRLSAARLFLFGARDIWFVVALPIYLAQQFSWSTVEVGGFLALWVIGYGFVQTLAPRLIRGLSWRCQTALFWVSVLTLTTAVLAGLLATGWQSQWVIVLGLMVFGGVFAVNSSLHSFLIVDYAREDGVSIDVGFYYMANAGGRLIGTILSGAMFQYYGFVACLWGAMLFLMLATLISRHLPQQVGH